jgi:hypothetical protein
MKSKTVWKWPLLLGVFFIILLVITLLLVNRTQQKRADAVRFIEMVKTAPQMELERARLLRAGMDVEQQERIDFIRQMQKRHDIRFNIEGIILTIFNRLKELQQAADPIQWEAMKINEGTWLVGVIWMEAGGESSLETTGSFFEVRESNKKEPIRWLLWQKDARGQYLDPLTERYTPQIQKLKEQYMRQLDS